MDDFEKRYKNGEPSAIIEYNSIVLKRSEYPDVFPQTFRVNYFPESKELFLEYELPLPEIIPSISEYRYIKSRDVIEKKPRKASELRDMYQDVIASISLLTIHEVFEADNNDHIQAVVFNGVVKTVDSALGKDIRPCLISIRVTKRNYKEINLKYINKIACLRNLKAQISPRPNEMMGIKPVIEFDMINKRPVHESDIFTNHDS